MSNVVQFYMRPQKPDNGARAAVIKYFEENPAAHPLANSLLRADHFLAALWVGGFKVVPLGPKDERP